MYWDDFEPGGSTEIGSWTFSEAEIIDFAKKYDPQPFHTDPVAAQSHEFGGVVASGFHVGSVWMKLMLARRAEEMKNAPPATPSEDGPKGAAGISPGFLGMRWHKPVRPGDTISFTNTTWRTILPGLPIPVAALSITPGTSMAGLMASPQRKTPALPPKP